MKTHLVKKYQISCCDQCKFSPARSSFSSLSSLSWIIFGFLHISHCANSCSWQRTAVPADRWPVLREVGAGYLSAICPWLVIYLKTRGHASKVWFTLGLTGLALIGSHCHDEALCGEFHLRGADRWWPVAISCTWWITSRIKAAQPFNSPL